MCCSLFTNFLADISRKKDLLDDTELYETPLRRTFGTFQLVLLGVGTMIGAGLYVLTGVEARNVTGPAIIVSYVLAAIASALSAMCYVEFACRIPRTGSAYTFTYVAIGEIWAFLIGWNLLLEYSIAAASVATSFMGYLDSLTDDAISNFTVSVIMRGNIWHVSYIAPYPDIFAALLVILTTVFIITGASISSWTNAVFLAVNMVVIGLIVIMGFTKADINNWKDYGGFAPYGGSGVLSGAATLFFSYVGFDTIAMANEETVNPKKSIPRATIISLLITCVSYVLSSAVLTLMVPYTELNASSAFTDAFASLGLEWTRWVVGIGALCAMFTTVLMNLYCLPRSVYAMATDGLLFECLGIVNSVTKVPIYASLFSMVLVVVPTLFFTLSQLVDFLSIGVLLGYTFVAGSVLILRYKPCIRTDSEDEPIEMASSDENSAKSREAIESSSTKDKDVLLNTSPSALPGTLKLRFRSTPLFRELLGFRPGVVVNSCVCTSVLFQALAIVILVFANQALNDAEWWAVILEIAFLICAIVPVLVICLHQQNVPTGDSYEVPWVPFVPALSIFCNMVLVLELDPLSWLRFLVWVIVGIVIYVFYGYRHSKVGRLARTRLNGATTGDRNGASYGSTE